MKELTRRNLSDPHSRVYVATLREVDSRALASATLSGSTSVMILESLKIAAAGLVGVISLVLAGMPEWAFIYAMAVAAALIALGLSRGA